MVPLVGAPREGVEQLDDPLVPCLVTDKGAAFHVAVLGGADLEIGLGCAQPGPAVEILQDHDQVDPAVGFIALSSLGTSSS
jgi:hypothetical protein